MARKSNSAFNVVGELVEARSFESGLRGAWFRCKIRKITKRHDSDVRFLEYYDFPDDSLKEIRLYQVPPHLRGKKGRNKPKELILRPQYPPIYKENQMPHAPTELTVIVDNSWKVGDLVDWWSDNCYWSGNITQLLDDDKAQVELKPPPHGEGERYQVFYKDLRPSLDWSPEQGWTIPCQEGESGRRCARFMKPTNQGIDGVPSKSAFSDEAKSTRTKEEIIKKRSREEENEEEGRNSSPKLALHPDTMEGAAGIDGVPSKSASSDEAKSTRTKEEVIKKRSREEENEEEGRSSSPKLALNPGTMGGATGIDGVPSKSTFSDEAKSSKTKEEMIKKRSPEEEKEEEGRNSSPKLALHPDTMEGAAGIDGVPSKSASSDEAKSTRTKEEVIKKRSREEENEEEGRSSSPKLALNPGTMGGATGIDGVPSKSTFSDEAKSSKTKEEMIKKRSPEEEKEEEGRNSSPKLALHPDTMEGAAGIDGVPSKSTFSDEAKSTRTKEEVIKKRSREEENEEEGDNSSPKLALNPDTIEGAVGIDGVPSKSAFSDEAKSTRTKEEVIKKRSWEEEEGRNSSPKLALNPDTMEGAAGIDGVPSKLAFSDEAKSSRTKEEMIKKGSPEEEKLEEEKEEEEGQNSSQKLALYPDTIEGAIMELEEYLNKVKWLKKVLHSGGISSPEPPQWELVDQNPKS